AFAHMIPLAERFTAGVQEVLDSRRMPWNIVQIGARAEYRFSPEPPRNGGQAAAAHDGELDAYMHVYLMNRGVLITPFHNMALMCPATTAEDIDRHSELFAGAVDELIGG
ncbi:MAG: glutamate-semialdehyde -aminomutase, partial [Gaiellales bacterium]|nr:glutamate-semialdehyde -aminomutase [Gaiellales bacterium]